MSISKGPAIISSEIGLGRSETPSLEADGRGRTGSVETVWEEVYAGWRSISLSRGRPEESEISLSKRDLVPKTSSKNSLLVNFEDYVEQRKREAEAGVVSPYSRRKSFDPTEV